MRLALYQPDQAGNVGTILRLAACLGVPLDIIAPCGFPFSDRALKRAGMDYAGLADVTRHADWAAFEAQAAGRLVLLTTAADGVRLDEARFRADDVLLMGSESAGAPSEVHARADLRVTIPQADGTRSLNVAVAAGIALAEALTQTRNWPGGPDEMSDVQTAEPFLHRKYDADRLHELELNKFTHALEMDRLKLLLLLNGGAFTVVGGFAESLFVPGATSPALFAGMGAWLAGLLLAAFATEDALKVQRAYAQAYHNRRRATEWRILGETDPPTVGKASPATGELPTLPARAAVQPSPNAASSDDAAANIAAFNREATTRRSEAAGPETRLKWLTRLSVLAFALGGLALLVGLVDRPPPPATPPAVKAGR